MIIVVVVAVVAVAVVVVVICLKDCANLIWPHNEGLSLRTTNDIP